MELLTYLQEAKSAAHLVDFCRKTLEQAGFLGLNAAAEFTLQPGGAYYVMPYPTCLFAFRVPENETKGFHIACAHTDAPCLKIKPQADLPLAAACKRLNVELYGGMLKRTWFDRPLAIAGQIMLTGEDAFSPKEILFDSQDAWAILPSLAPHMDREIETREIDKQKEMMPLYLLGDSEQSFLELLSEKIGVRADEVLSFDLNLYDPQAPQFVGMKKDLISASRIDNVSSVAALMEGLLTGDAGPAGDAAGTAGRNSKEAFLPVIALLDHEEVGSRSKQGADSELLSWILEKIAKALGADYKNLGMGGGMLSVDVAHAVHPNYPEKADTTTTAVLGRGFVCKTSHAQRYVTDVKMTAVLTALCKEAGILMQMQANRNSIPGGQTLGPIASSYLPIPAADLGIPILAMHSIRELCSLKDYEALEALMRCWLA